MGYRRYDARRGRRAGAVELEPASALGLLRDVTDSRFAEPDAEHAGAAARGRHAARRRARDLLRQDAQRLDRAPPRATRLGVGEAARRATRSRSASGASSGCSRTARCACARPTSRSWPRGARAMWRAWAPSPARTRTRLALEAYDCLPVEFLLPGRRPPTWRARSSRIVAAAERRRARGHERRRPDEPLVLRLGRAAAAALRGALPRARSTACSRRATPRATSTTAARSSTRTSRSSTSSAAATTSSTCRALADARRRDARDRRALGGPLRGGARRRSAERRARCASPRPTPTPSPSRTAWSPRRPPKRCSTCATSSACARRVPVELGLDFATEYGDARTHRLKIYLRERPYLTDSSRSCTSSACASSTRR